MKWLFDTHTCIHNKHAYTFHSMLLSAQIYIFFVAYVYIRITYTVHTYVLSFCGCMCVLQILDSFQECSILCFISSFVVASAFRCVCKSQECFLNSKSYFMQCLVQYKCICQSFNLCGLSSSNFPWVKYQLLLLILARTFLFQFLFFHIPCTTWNSNFRNCEMCNIIFCVVIQAFLNYKCSTHYTLYFPQDKWLVIFNLSMCAHVRTSVTTISVTCQRHIFLWQFNWLVDSREKSI